MKVRFSQPAQRQADTLDRWWRQNRPAAKKLFAQELARAGRLLARWPELGPPFVERNGVLVRRVVLRKSGNHVYY